MERGTQTSGVDSVGYQVHPTAVVEEGARIGDGTRIWHFAHVRSGATIGAACSIGKDVFVDAGVQIGDRCKVQNGVSVYKGVTLEEAVFVGPHVAFTNDRTPRAASTEWKLVPTLVRHDASIGANATIVCGTQLGAFAMVGAGAVVTRDVADHELVVGNPASHAGWVCRCGAVCSRAAEPPSDFACGRHGGSGELAR